MNTVTEDQSKNNRFITFSLGNESYAIPLLSIKEVIAVPEITPLPFAPSYFLGLMNLRGQVISAIDLRLKFNIKPQATSENAVIICDLGSTQLGMLVDSVNAVITPKDSEISEAPTIEGTKHAEFISSVFRHQDQLILLVDLDKTLTAEDRKAMKRAV